MFFFFCSLLFLAESSKLYNITSTSYKFNLLEFCCVHNWCGYVLQILKLWSIFVAASLTALFKHIGSTDDRTAEDLNAWETIREKVLCFIRDKVSYF